MKIILAAALFHVARCGQAAYQLGLTADLFDGRQPLQDPPPP